MPLISGLNNAPVTRILLVSFVALSLVASATDTKHLLPIHIPLHLGRLRQFWRLLTWQAAYSNSTEVFFAGLTLYQLRVIERIWGSRKFATALITIFPYTTLLPPVILAIFSPVLPSSWTFLPSGPTPLVFALLAQYHAAIPYTFRYRLSTSRQDATSSQAENEEESGVLLTSKATSYLLPAQLAFSHLPGSLVAAMIGWCVGYAWRADVLPGSGRGWRVPGWVVGQTIKSSGAESIRNRMRDEARASNSRRQD